MIQSEVIRETPKYVIYKNIWGSGEAKEKKFLCIGGIYDGLMKSYTQVYKEGYYQFNNGGGNRLAVTAVYIHETSLIAKVIN